MKLSNRIELPVEFDNLFDHMFGHYKPTQRRGFVPRTDIVEQEKSFLLTLELPGVDPGHVAVEVADGRLTISGEKTVEGRSVAADDESTADTSTVHQTERIEGKFERQFEFPIQVDFDKIVASANNGVLTVNVPKSEKVLPRKIDVRVN